jgi:hypothetical protein
MKECVLELGDLGFERGGHLLVKRALRELQSNEHLRVRGDCKSLGVHLRAWCRAQGHAFDAEEWVVRRGDAQAGRWRGAERSGHADVQQREAVADTPPLHWGLAARGAMIEQGTPDFDFSLNTKTLVWADEAAKLYKQAAAAQWDPNTAIDWNAPIEHPPEVEDAVVQVMTYLIENETVALLVPARFLAKIHPHFREVMQLLAIQTADEARHIEVFTRRAQLNRSEMGLSTVGGQESLKTLLDEPDFALSSFLLSVLGEGSFLSLLWFLRDYAPDPVTRQVATMTATDEARHVAFGMAHLTRHASIEKGLLERLAMAIERRHDALSHTAGLNEEVFDALVLLAAGSWEPAAIAKGWDQVMKLKANMANGRVKRMRKIGFSLNQAESLATLHTRNFM